MLARTQPIPLPALPSITTRVATMDDLPFVDALQKKHSKQLGFFPRQQLEGYLKNGWMRIAEEVGGVASSEYRVARECEEASALATRYSSLATSPVGYIAFRDRYLKRDELGAVFQLCVEPGRQRGLIGATLLQSAFDASAYGCKLFCCWCAQDLAANRFWEAMGFVPIAFRTGSATRGKNKSPRVHLFWQKRIRAGDVSTPWWYPSGTDGGALRADRIVLPIPAGTHWSDAKPIVLPGVGSGQSAVGSEERKRLPSPKTMVVAPPVVARPSIAMGGLRAAPPTPEAPAAIEKPKREKRPAAPKARCDPRLAAMARELRDRWLERADDSGIAQALPRYEVTRAIAAEGVRRIESTPTTRLLSAA